MIRALLTSSLRFRGLIVAAAAAVAIVAVTQLRHMPVDVLPEFGPTTVEVQTEALGLSAPEVEQLITVPMEQDLLNGVAFLKDIRSESVPGLSRILMIFEPGTDLYRARQAVAERLTQAHALPNVSKPPQMLEPLSATNRVMMVALSSQHMSPIQMSVLARWTIVPRLMGVPGVANVSIWGNRDRQLQVLVDPQRLRNAGVSLEQVITSTGNALWFSPLSFVEASTPGTGGFVDTANQRLSVQHFSPITTPGTLAKVSLEDTGAKKLKLGDVASVVEDHQPLIGDAVVGSRQGLLLVVQKFPGASTVEVTRGIENAINAMKPGLRGIQFDTSVYRPASYIDKSIRNLRHALIIGAALLVVAFLALLAWWRLAAVAVIAIPLSLGTGALVLYAFGGTMNAVAFAGLVAALALVIDEAVVDADAVTRRVREERACGSERPLQTLVLEAAVGVRGSVVYGSLIVALAMLPLFFLHSVSGAFFPSIAAAFLLAIGAAMVVALTVTPALTLLSLSSARATRAAPPLGRRLRTAYGGMLSRFLQRPDPVYFAAGLFVLGCIAAAPHLKQSLLPQFKETQVLIRWDGAPGTSLDEMNRVTRLAAREFRALPGVRDVGAHVGRAVTADQVVGVNSGEIWVAIDPKANYDATLASVKRVAVEYPGLSGHVQTYSNERVDEVLAGSTDDVTVRLYGENLGVLEQRAAAVRRSLAGIPGVRSSRVDVPPREPSIQIKVDLAAAERYGVKPGDVRRAAATLLSGIGVGSLFEEQKVFDVVVWGTPSTRSNLTAIRHLLIDTPGGGHVQLGRVAGVRIVPTPAVIRRQAVSRYIDVVAGVHGRDRGAVVHDVNAALSRLTFPLEVHPEVQPEGGQPLGRLIALAVAAAVGILLLLQAAFGSWRLAALSFVLLPLALVGGVLAAFADGGTLSFGSYAGLFAVYGIAARSAILLVERFRELEREGGSDSPAMLVVHGATDRSLPVVTTAVATALALAPVVLSGPIAGLELVQPMAIVILGGLVTSTLLSLFVLPTAYFRLRPSLVGEPSLASALQLRIRALGRRGDRPQELPVRSESTS